MGNFQLSCGAGLSQHLPGNGRALCRSRGPSPSSVVSITNSPAALSMLPQHWRLTQENRTVHTHSFRLEAEGATFHPVAFWEFRLLEHCWAFLHISWLETMETRSVGTPSFSVPLVPSSVGLCLETEEVITGKVRWYSVPGGSPAMSLHMTWPGPSQEMGCSHSP